MTIRSEKFLPTFVNQMPFSASDKTVSGSKTHLKITTNSIFHFTDITRDFPPSDIKFQIIFNNKTEVHKNFGRREKTEVFSLLRETKTLQLVSSELGHGYVFDDDPKSKPQSLKKIFRPTISIKEKTVFLYIFQEFIDICRQNNITYFIYGGTLIGSYRHHGFIPWDDDVDVFVDSRKKQFFKETVSKNYPNFTAGDHTNFQWKFYHNVLSVYRRNKVRWPYIDIFFYNTNKTHVYDVTYGYKRNPIFKKETIFPLRKRPFEGALLESPQRTDSMLNQMYNISNCRTNSFSHKYERPSKWSKNVRCTELYKHFPFVIRVFSITALENLVEAGKVVNSFQIKNYEK